ncbi:MAG: sortase [Ilumatobacteraceae bacterium]
MNELLDDRSPHDAAVIARLRAALDEVSAAGSGSLPASHRSGIGPGRWLAIAAAAVLVVGAATAVVIHRNNAPDTVSSPIEVATTVPTPTTTVTEPTLIRVVTPRYTLVSQDLVPGAIQETTGDPTTGMLTMAWARNAGVTEGLLVLTELGDGQGISGDVTLQPIDGGQLAFGSYGIDRQEREALAAQVVSGSGLPYVLPVDGWQLLAMGRQTFFGEAPAGHRQSQEFSNESGTVTLSVGDYAGEFAHLLTGSVASVTVAGQAGWASTNDTGTMVIWPAGESGQWATLDIPPAFAERVDGLIAAVAEVPTGEPTVETVPAPDDGSDAHVTVTGEALPMFDASAADPAIGLPAPAVIGHDYAGDEVRIDPSTGPQLVLFVAHWCPHCNATLPKVIEWMADGTIPQWLPVTVVSTAESPSSAGYPADTWLAEKGWTGRVIRDVSNGDGAAGAVAATYGANGWPYFVLIGADGNVAARVSGELDGAGMQALLAPVEAGATVGRLQIPSIDLDRFVVAPGDDLEQAKQQGPVLVVGAPESVGVDQPISVIWGNRTTYGAPFLHIDQLVAGDTITWTGRNGTVTFEVIGSASSTDPDTLAPPEGTMLQLRAYAPEFTSRETLVVNARRVD